MARHRASVNFGSSVANIVKAQRQYVTEEVRKDVKEGGQRPTLRRINATSRRGRGEAVTMLRNFIAFLLAAAAIFALQLQEMDGQAEVPNVLQESRTCPFYTIPMSRLKRRGFQSNFVYPRKPLLVSNDDVGNILLTEDSDHCNVDDDESIMRGLMLPDWADHFVNHTFSMGGRPESNLSKALTADLTQWAIVRDGDSRLPLQEWDTSKPRETLLTVLSGAFRVSVEGPGSSGDCTFLAGSLLYLPERGGINKKRQGLTISLTAAIPNSTLIVLSTSSPGHKQWPAKAVFSSLE